MHVKDNEQCIGVLYYIRATEPGFAGDICPIELWLIDIIAIQIDSSLVTYAHIFLLTTASKYHLYASDSVM